MSTHLLLLFCMLIQAPITIAIDCFDGFQGIVQDNVDAIFERRNVTYSPVCAAEWCAQILIYDAFGEAPNSTLRQKGIRAMCAYTGGDRALCEHTAITSAATNCSTIAAYSGMFGNFAICCCQTHMCNRISRVQVESVLAQTDVTSQSNSIRILLPMMYIGIMLILID